MTLSLKNNFEEAFPVSIRNIVRNVVIGLAIHTHNYSSVVSNAVLTYRLHDDWVHIPYRVYLSEIADDKILQMNNIEKLVVHCILSRSSHGGIREHHIKAILSTEFPYWAIPYVVKVCDEYVLKILQMVYENLKASNTNDIKKFWINNSVAFIKSYNRMVSYWNEYHRKDNPNIKDYVGQKLFVECFGYKNT